MVRGYYSDVNGTPGTTVNFDPSEIFVDLSSPSFDYRLKKLKWFSALDADKTNGWLQKGLSHTFDLLYTKRKMYLPPEGRVQQMMQNVKRDWLKGLFRKSIVGSLLRMIALYLQFGAIGLFHHSHRQAYNDRDVKVTYALLCCTAALEFFGQLALDIVNTAERKSSSSIGRSKTGMDGNVSQHMDAMLYQHNLIGCFICNQRHYIRSFATDYLDQRWQMKSSSSSRCITSLVLQHSVLLWHLATDFCYYTSGSYGRERSIHHKSAVQCRELSNYMMYLLFNPVESADARRNFFTIAYNQLKACMQRIITWMQQERLVHRKIRNTLVHEPLRALRHRITALIEKALVARTTPNFVRIVYNKLEAFIQRIIASRQQPLEEITNEDTPPSDGTGLIDDAWSIAEELLKLDDEEKMWRVIEGVWVEMLCFSAARCRGYLHAKCLGTGGSS
uniref:DUF4220 domain-containing protein n=1 Tax=Oryza rufipogon TaxID=4529 RepID=A0A0E0Q6H0_ORYRU